MRHSLTITVLGLSLPVVAWMTLGFSRGRPAESPATRAIEPRLTNVVEYAPCQPVTDPQRLISRARCSGFPEPDVISQQAFLERQGLEEREESATRGGAEDLQVGALSALASPRGLGSIEVAVRRLEAAARTAPDDSRIFANLAAARFVLAQQIDEPFELVRALAAAEKASMLDSSLLEARFNRALILDTLFLRDQARVAWQEYLMLDGESGWAQEAREHLSGLEQPSLPEIWASRLPALQEAASRGQDKMVLEIVSLSPQAAREHALEELLGAWGERTIAGRDAAEPLRRARAIGLALEKVHGDLTVLRSVQVIEEAQARGSRAVAALARGHMAYSEAARLFKQLLTERAAPLANEATSLLAEGGSPIELWAELVSAGIVFYESRFDEAFPRLRTIADRAESAEYPALAGRARWGMGLIRLRQGRFSESLRQYRVAIQHFERVREQENLGSVHGMVAENLRFLGQDPAAWRHRYRSIALLAQYPKSMRLHNALWEGGAAALEDGEPAAALLLQNEGLLVARRSGDPGMVAEALLRRSEIQMALGDSGAAARDLDEARLLNSRFEDREIREKLDADIWYAEGKLWSATAPERALESLSDALGYYEEHDLSLELVQTYLSRALIWRAAGQQKEEDEDLADALAVFERQRESLADNAMRTSYSETVQELFDETIWMWAKKGGVEQALKMSERARILPHASRSTAGPADFSEVLSKIPEDAVFVEYALLRDRLLTWVVRRGRVDLIDRPIEPEILEGRVRAFVSALRTNAPVRKIDKASVELHDLLIPAEVRALPASVELRFVPDKILNAVPFAALKGRDGGYLVEKHPVVVAPSITHSLRVSPQAVAMAEGPASALLAGATVFDQNLFDLRDLPGAQEEIQEIQQLYPEAQVMLGGEVTRPGILEAIGQQEVFQFSGHGVFNPRHPDHSYFVVAPLPDRSDTGMVFAHEIAGHDLSRLRLVVLSACDSLGPLDTRMTAFSGMARPFLDAGVSVVLGTLWKVDDRASAALIPGFHRKFIRGGDCSRALRSVQLSVLRELDSDFGSPAFWGSFACVGSGH